MRKHIRIDRPAEQVWQVVSDVGAIADWFPMLEASSASGTTRPCTMAVSGELEEEIVTNDSELRRLQYRITKGVVLEYHLATVDVLEDRDGALVIYSADVEPTEAADMMGPFESGLEGLKAHLER
ncbi:MAG: SRPBCC family protein [Acidimicrobiia bacterium]